MRGCQRWEKWSWGKLQWEGVSDERSGREINYNERVSAMREVVVRKLQWEGISDERSRREKTTMRGCQRWEKWLWETTMWQLKPLFCRVWLHYCIQSTVSLNYDCTTIFKALCHWTMGLIRIWYCIVGLDNSGWQPRLLSWLSILSR